MMRRALRLAKKGAGRVSPNPLVGAVIVRDGEIVAEGYHHQFGADHAEVDALKKLDFKAKDCDMYVNLEPCSHSGKTPPCAEALIKAGVRSVHVAMIDPNPLVAGKGVRMLQEAGIPVEVGLLENDAQRLNESFVKFITTRIPFVVAKAAMSLDGKIATRNGDSGQKSGGISGADAHRYVQELRRDLDAILVGGGTVKADNPRLTCRLDKCPRQPVRVVLDGLGVAPAEAQVFDASVSPTIVVTSRNSDAAWRKAVAARGAEVWLLRGTKGIVNISEVLQKLGQREIASVLLEGGSDVLGGFLRAGLIDRFDLIYSPRLIGGDGLPLFGGEGAVRLSDSIALSVDSVRRLDDDILVTAYPHSERS
jgi:diaminohydroxyphosphoribosylaminopyrimidine deaminase/5-amino-6-(5-phosphoribosylamino)uracil reductase